MILLLLVLLAQTWRIGELRVEFVEVPPPVINPDSVVKSFIRAALERDVYRWAVSNLSCTTFPERNPGCRLCVSDPRGQWDLDGQCVSVEELLR